MEISIEQYNKMAERLTELEYKEAEQKANSTSDLISRQATIDWLKREWDGMVTSVFKGIENLPFVQSEIIYCKDCKHRPKKSADYDDDSWDRGFNIEFPDYRCPCQCEDGYYNRFPEDDWFCGNGDRKEE